MPQPEKADPRSYLVMLKLPESGGNVQNQPQHVADAPVTARQLRPHQPPGQPVPPYIADRALPDQSGTLEPLKVPV